MYGGGGGGGGGRRTCLLHIHQLTIPAKFLHYSTLLFLHTNHSYEYQYIYLVVVWEIRLSSCIKKDLYSRCMSKLASSMEATPPILNCLRKQNNIAYMSTIFLRGGSLTLLVGRKICYKIVNSSKGNTVTYNNSDIVVSKRLRMLKFFISAFFFLLFYLRRHMLEH